MFQHFRLGEMAMHQPLPPHLMQHQGTTTNINGAPQFSANAPNNFVNNPPTISSSSGSKQPYGSGDSDDGYTLVFPNLQAFNEWREKEEETQIVEFVKGDTHGSKAVPPRFKDHTKLVCARHSRSGRKKYVKKHPERVRKVPSRKLEGQGCPASISFKTYFDTDEVRVCYVSQHSHEIGLANLPFTRRGRKAALAQDKGSRKQAKLAQDQTGPPPPSMGSSVAGPSNQYSSAMSMIAPLPGHPVYHPGSQPAYGYAPSPQFAVPGGSPMSQERWDNMATLFQSIRDHARSFEYPSPSVAALESCLIRLFLESPVVASQGGMPGVIAGALSLQAHAQQQSISTTQTSTNAAGHTSAGPGSDGSGSEDSSCS